MILILEDSPAALGLALADACAQRGIESIWLSRQRIVQDVGIELHISTQWCDSRLSIGTRDLPLSEVAGVYCGFDSFPPMLWPDFSPDDADYAAKETHAIWLALLASLPCRPVNPPSPDALGGAAYSPVELFLAAHKSSLSIPATAYLDLVDARSLLHTPITATLCDLGSENQQEQALENLTHFAAMAPGYQLRLRERLPGPRHVLCVVGKLIFASTCPAIGGESEPLELKMIPSQVVTGVYALHAQLGLVLAEYHFVTLPSGDWILDDHSRMPGLSTWTMHSQALVSALLNNMLSQADDDA